MKFLSVILVLSLLVGTGYTEMSRIIFSLIFQLTVVSSFLGHLAQEKHQLCSNWWKTAALALDSLALEVSLSSVD